MDILIYIIPFAVCSPLLIIGILKFRNLFSYKKSNLESVEAELEKSDYTSSRMGSNSTYTYSYLTVGTYKFEVDGKEYNLTYTVDRQIGHLPKKLTACYPKGRPHKAFEEHHAPIVKEFFTAAAFIAGYGIAASQILLIALYIFG